MTSKSTALKYTFKSDVLFKMLFVTHPHLLKRLVAVLLEIPLQSIENFQLINTEMPPEEIGKKFCRLDIDMEVDGTKVNLEVQVADTGHQPERSLFHWARICSSALPAGHNYSQLPRTIIISILGYKQFDCKEVHSEYQVLEINRHTPLSDKAVWHFFELPKLQEAGSVNPNNEQDLWLALFNAKTEEELENLVSTGGEVMSQAIEAYRSITATDEFKYLEYLRTKTQHDEAQAIWYAEQRGEQRADEKWQSVLADKDAQLERLRSQLAALQPKPN